MTIKSGTIHRVFVFNNQQILIGTGFIIESFDKHIHNPMLFKLDGEPLPNGYYTLRVRDEFPTSCIIPLERQ
jgi:hypothetical protein